MNKEKYLELRNGLYTEAEALINEGKLEEGQAKMTEIEKLDNDFENSAKALANLNALKDSSKISNIAPIVRENKIGEVAAEDMTDSIEYRKAFMNYVSNGIEIPSIFKNAVSTTTDAGETIPNTVMARIVEKIESTGMILPLITRTNYKGGVTIPTSKIKPEATWVQEGKGSSRQKKTIGSIVFGYKKLRCEIANTLEVDVMALPVFETVFINNVAEAMVKALEKAIISGEGGLQPKGILHNEVIKEVQTAKRFVEIASNKSVCYQDLIKAEGLLELAYETDAVWFMTKKKFMEYAGMVDSTGQPIARVSYGINGRIERVLLGRTVILNDYMPSTVDGTLSGVIESFLFNPKDYALNTNLNITVKTFEDNSTDDIVKKAIMLADGQVVDNNSLVLIVKKQ